MAKFRSIKNSLIAGEISPTAMGRTDLPQYQHACKILRNAIPLLSGGAYRRPGTFYEKEYLGSSYYAPRLIPFIVSKSWAYNILLKYIGGVGTVDIFRATSNTAVATTTTMTGNHPYLPCTTNIVGSSPLGYGQYDEWHEVQYVQSADVLYLVHPNRIPQRIIRSGGDVFSIVDFDNGLSGTALRDCRPYRAQNTTSTTLTINNAAVGTGRTLTASAALFTSSMVGAYFKVYDTGTAAYGFCKVTGYTSSTVVTVQVIVAFGSTNPMSTWWESSWSPYRGYPRSVCFFKGRIVYGGNIAEPDSLWLSQSANYDVMSVASIITPTSSPTGSQPFQVTLASLQLNSIQWLSSEKTLFVGTFGDEWIIDKETTSSGFGCDNCSPTVQTHYGSAYNQVARFGNEIAFCLPSEQEVRSLVFNNDQDNYVAEPVQLLYDEKPQVDLGPPQARKYRLFQWDESRKTLWCVDTRGNLFGMTRDRTLQINAWHSHELGGFDADVTGGTIGSGNDKTLDPIYYAPTGSVVSLAVVPNPVIGFNDVWLVVKRKINGQWQYMLERMIGGLIPNDSAYDGVSNVSGNYYADCCVYTSGTAPSMPTVTHLVPEALSGTAYSTLGLFEIHAVTTSGSAVLSRNPPGFATTAYQIALGLPFDCIIQPVRLEAGSQIGTSQGALKRIDTVHARFYRTIQAEIGRDADNLETIVFREGDTALNQSAELFTGDKNVPIEGDYDRDGYVYLKAGAALPFALMAVVVEGMTYD